MRSALRKTNWYRQIAWRYARVVRALTPAPPELQRNQVLKGAHRGERCFVIANGASLAGMDLQLLEGEKVFTVNRFLLHAEKLRVDPFCHTLIDIDFFNGVDPTHLLERIRDTDSQGTRIYIFPLDAKPKIESVLGEKFQGRLFYIAGGDDLNLNRNVKLTHWLPAFQTVTLAALASAMYMGFSNIYLIGCDMDLLTHVVSVDPLILQDRHFYDQHTGLPYEEKSYDYTGYVHAIVKMLRGFAFLKGRLNRGQKIWNAGVGGHLDLFERVDFTSLFEKQIEKPIFYPVAKSFS